MRFKKGTKVEVLCKTQVPRGSWRCAEIIGGNGHYFSIRYDGYDDGTTGEAIVVRVPRKAVRPCPPVIEVTEDWKPGDVVEVCRNFSWSMAAVSKVFGEKYVLVRLLGSSFEFMVNKIDIRVRQSWQDEEWIVIGKGSSSCGNGKYYKTLALGLSSMFSAQAQKTITKTKQSCNHDYLNDKKKVNYQNSHLAASKTFPRKSHPHVELYTEPLQKFRATSDEFSRTDKKRRKHIDTIGFTFADNFETNEDSVSSSVGSCSDDPESAVPFEDLEVATSDAESACHCRYEEGNCLLSSSEDEMEVEIHKLELHAYRCIIEALHASGPLSWDQETLITDLRLSLHISDDEHSTEIKNLISSENIIHVR